MKLSGRLLELAQLVDKHKNGIILADIGTDHAYLPCYLIEKNIIEKAYACDVAQGPFKASLSTIEHYHFAEKIEALLGNGLNPILDKDVSMITIAGMGAFLIGDILEENKDMYLIEHAELYNEKYLGIAMCIGHPSVQYEHPVQGIAILSFIISAALCTSLISSSLRGTKSCI